MSPCLILIRHISPQLLQHTSFTLNRQHRISTSCWEESSLVLEQFASALVSLLTNFVSTSGSWRRRRKSDCECSRSLKRSTHHRRPHSMLFYHRSNLRFGSKLLQTTTTKPLDHHLRLNRLHLTLHLTLIYPLITARCLRRKKKNQMHHLLTKSHQLPNPMSFQQQLRAPLQQAIRLQSTMKFLSRRAEMYPEHTNHVHHLTSHLPMLLLPRVQTNHTSLKREVCLRRYPFQMMTTMILLNECLKTIRI